jgi:bacillithiol biosynthesis cysteine-adding enzyme BshC
MLKLYETIKLPYAGLISPIVADYLKKDDFLTAQVQGWFEPKSFESLIKTRNFSSSQRQILVQSLIEKYTNLKLISHKKAKQQIESLAKEDTFTITTGHQLSLFGGTFFMAFKILKTIKLGRELKLRFPENDFVPILWLASEDHDFEEIKGTWWQNKYLTWDTQSFEKPTGELSVQTLQPVVEELLISLETMGGIGSTLKQWIKNAYQGNHTLAEASINYYHNLFAEEGLIVIDANQKTLKEALKPVITKDLFTEDNYTAQLISDRRLSERYKLQIKARNGNIFYLHETHGRRMIKKQKKGFKLADTDMHFGLEEMKVEIENYPERFSPNVNVRPIYQELILPNIAYIGGPAEIAYWLQLKPIFDANKVNFPALVLRFMGAVVPDGIEKKLSKLQLSTSAVLGNPTEVTERYLAKVNPFDYNLAMNKILNEYQSIIDSIIHKEPGLAKEFLTMKLEAKRAFKSRRSDYKMTTRKGKEEAIARLLKIRSSFYPNGILQERIETYLSLQLKVGLNLNKELLEIISPFESEFNLLKTELRP